MYAERMCIFHLIKFHRILFRNPIESVDTRMNVWNFFVLFAHKHQKLWEWISLRSGSVFFLYRKGKIGYCDRNLTEFLHWAFSHFEAHIYVDCWNTGAFTIVKRAKSVGISEWFVASDLFYFVYLKWTEFYWTSWFS